MTYMSKSFGGLFHGPALDPPERWETCPVHGYDVDACPCNDRAADEQALLPEPAPGPRRAVTGHEFDDFEAGLVGHEPSLFAVGFERLVAG